MKIGAVLINWNAGEFTMPCMDSLQAGTVRPDRTLVLDNGSRDGSPDAIAARFPQAELIRNGENLGFAKACNIGIAALLRDGMDAVWLLNNDTIVEPGCLAALRDGLSEPPGADVATGKILYAEPAGHIWYAGGALHPGTLRARHRGLGKRDRGQYDTAADVSFVSGCCLLATRHAFEEAGLLNPHYFAYLEDVEWCLRAGRRGLSMRYTPGAVLVHRVSASTRKNTLASGGGVLSARAHYLEARNGLFTLRLHARGLWHRTWAASAFALHAAWLLAGLTCRARWPKIRAITTGIRDGITAKIGKQPRLPYERTE